MLYSLKRFVTNRDPCGIPAAMIIFLVPIFSSIVLLHVDKKTVGLYLTGIFGFAPGSGIKNAFDCLHTLM